VINLSDSTLQHHQVINFKPGLSDKLIEKVGRSEWQLRKHLNRENILDHNFTAHLMEIILADPNLEAFVREKDVRTIDNQVVFSNAQSNDNHVVTKESTANTEETIMILILITLLAERIVAFRRNQ
jgi:hypothetical protein